MLHCSHLNEKLEFGMETAAMLQHSFLTLSNNKVLPCRSAIIDLGLDSVDPGLVPDGAKCGIDKMCIQQKCVPVESILSVNACESNCNGNGVCDNTGKCHCFEGFGPPNCEFPLPRGYHITLALYIIFLCILPLTSLSAFIAYYFHEHIKTWWIVKARKAAIKSRAKEGTHRTHPRIPSHFDLRSLEISEPITLDASDDVIVSEVKPQNSKFRNQGLRRSFRGVEISAPIVLQSNSSYTESKKPVRPAPPPPSQNRSFTRSASTQSRGSSTSSRGSIKSRPRCPPPPIPPPPPPPNISKYQLKQLEEERALDFSNTKLDFVHQGDYSRHNHSSSGPRCYQHSQASFTSSDTSSDNSSRELCTNSQSRVGLLTKHFESKNWSHT
ncbi:disintegrin and metalloproteinase domain-containing protein 19-like protein [Dinothrombium tinctorium]|uniref:Disintegrin and metalloproteinase domain-containing protein 19-like protein n=1 Tax=Dinothrombium tinctorium TaxID=1965070 RepID=A0A3S3NM18_9ACAR|nr:disintegrin and metalloproteinase domain-containing protein 19-like protein [Dinothrombium tinctorium]